MSDVTQKWFLPDSVSTRGDVGRLLRELEMLSDFLGQASIRQPGTAVQAPKTSNVFDEMVTKNKLNMLQEDHRSKLKNFLSSLREKAPVLHVSFSAEPSPMISQQLTAWVRQNLHPYIILQIGLNPSIGAGCILRTTNKFFDLSLREKFNSQKAALAQQLHGDAPVQQQPAAQQAVQAQEPVAA